MTRPTTAPSTAAARCPVPVRLPVARTTPFDPPEELGRLRADDPLRPLVYPDGHVGWLVTSYALARGVLADSRFSARSELKRVPVRRPGAEPFIGEPALPGWFVDMDPPEHTRYRRLLAGQFTLRRLTRLQPEVDRIVAGRLDALAAAGPPADLVELFALPIPSLMICELLGVPYADRESFQRDSNALFSLKVTAREGAEAMDRLTGYLLELVRRKRARPRDDLLSGLILSGGLGDAQIAGAGVLLLTAGHETVASMLGLGTYALLSHPAQKERLTAGAVQADVAVEELLRYLTIFQFGVPRSPLEDVELAGRTIRKGESVTVCLPAANRDPHRFELPDELDLGRAARGHLAFGYGVHQCIGQNLARMELRTALPALLRRFPELEPAVPAHEIPLSNDAGFYGVHRLPVRWQDRDAKRTG